MDFCVSFYGEEFGFIVYCVVICICCTSSGYACYLVLNYLELIEVGSGDDWSPCGGGIFYYWSCY